MVVLTETSPGPGTALLGDGLRISGYEVYGDCAQGDRGVIVAARPPVEHDVRCKQAITLPSRAVCVGLPLDPPLAVLGLYVPSRDRSPAKVERKSAFLESLLGFLGQLPAAQRDSLLLVGDFNVVSRAHEPPLRGYFDFEYGLFETLEEFGFRAAHELRPRQAFPHSWIGRNGAGYLYDYVFAGAALRDRIARCTYMHGPRQTGLTDHAGLTVACWLDPANG